jgi:hypothetical protein
MFKKSEIDKKIDEEILRVLAAMEQDDNKNTKEYASMVDQVSKLNELRHKSGISKETLVTIGANLGGIAAILFHERVNVITSKAFGLVKKIV